MKLGCAYSVFNGEELLQASIECIRDYVDHVHVSYQLTSNHGTEADPNLFGLIMALKKQKLIDTLHYFVPLPKWTAKQNEALKREQARDFLHKTGCTHFISMDCDEFYEPERFEEAKLWCIELQAPATAVELLSYYKTPEYQLTPKESYYCPFICEIEQEIDLNNTWDIVVDSSRKAGNNDAVVIPEFICEMHHMSYVRTDLRSKLENAASKHVYDGKVDDILWDFENWEYPDPVNWAGQYKQVKKIKPIFVL